MENTNFTERYIMNRYDESQKEKSKITLGTCGSLRVIDPNMYYKYDNKFLPAICYLIGLQQSAENAVTLWDDGLEDELLERMEALNEESELSDLVSVVDLQDKMEQGRVNSSYLGTVSTSVTVDSNSFVFVSYHTGTEFHEYVVQKLSGNLEDRVAGPKYALVYENTGTTIRFFDTENVEDKFLPSVMGSLPKNSKIYKGAIIKEFVPGKEQLEGTLDAYITANFDECTYIGFWEIVELIAQMGDDFFEQLSDEMLKFVHLVRDKVASVHVFDAESGDLYRVCNTDEAALLEVIKKLQLSKAGISFMLFDE